MSSDFIKALKVESLAAYLEDNGVSEEATKRLRDNKVSGRALLLLDRSELKELLPAIGDLAIVRDIIGSAGEAQNENTVKLSERESTSFEKESTSSEKESTLSEKGSTSFTPVSNMINIDDMSEDSASEMEELSKESYHSDCSETDNNHAEVEPQPKKVKKEKSVIKKFSSLLTKRGHEPPLPRPFDIPQNFPEVISLALESKKLRGKPRTKFITIIAQSIYRFKNYPTDAEYIQVAQDLAKKWPFLDDGKGLGYLIVALKMRMAYLRKPDSKKRGNPLKTERKHVSPDKGRMPAVPVFALPCGEDEESHQRHVKVLKSELKKVNPSKQVLKKLMEKTFVLRRKEISEGMGSVHDILAAYEALKLPEELNREFARMMERDLQDECAEIWYSLVAKILSIAEDNETAGLAEYLEAYSCDEVSDDYRSFLALGCLAYMIPDVRTKTDHTKIFNFLERSDITEGAAQVATNQPCLLVKSEEGAVKDCYLIVEKKVAMKLSNVRTALFCLFSSFYVFNVSYPVGCNTFYMFVENIFLKKKVVGRKPRLTALLAELSQ